jgi:hypothetical protein
LSRNLGTLTSWNPLGHSRPVTGLLYLLQFQNIYCTVFQTKVSTLRKRKPLFFVKEKRFQDSLLDSSTADGVHSLHFNVLNKTDSVHVM